MKYVKLQQTKPHRLVKYRNTSAGSKELLVNSDVVLNESLFAQAKMNWLVLLSYLPMRLAFIFNVKFCVGRWDLQPRTSVREAAMLTAELDMSPFGFSNKSGTGP